MTSGRPISKEIKEYIANSYDEKTSKEIASEIRRKFAIKIYPVAISKIISEQFPEGTHLHDFFDFMISDFKIKYGKVINKESSKRLLFKISSFVEDEYKFGGLLNRHERTILSRVLDKRKDIIFLKNENVLYAQGVSKGKIGYFK